MTSTIRIAVCDDWEHCALECADWSTLQQRADVQIFTSAFPSRDEAIAILKDFDAICLMRERTPFPKEVIAKLPRLRRLLYTGERNLSVDSEFARSQGITVSGTPGGPNKASTAEHTWSMILGATRRTVPAMTGLLAGYWRGDPTGEPYALPDTLEGDRLGILGLGGIGARVARIGQAIGMEVVAWSQNLTDEKAAEHGVRRVEKNELLATSKIISLHLVLSDRTRGLIGPTEVSLMRRDSVLVNTSRAGLIDETALIEALDSGRPSHAALDVFTIEPLPKDHPILGHSAVTLTPHLGFVSTRVYEMFYKTIVNDLSKWVEEREPR
ncbi:MAG: D-2-hydroxyacid dehydrogenase family protein [Burkholderiales bacterium]